MKLKLLPLLLMFVTLLLTSCEPEATNTNENNPDITQKNYWSSNTLVRLQLRGKVKVVEGEYERMEFNDKGFIVKRAMIGSEGSSTNYNYGSGGELTWTTSTFGLSNPDTIFYTYESHGKYIVNSPFHLYETGLTPNLKSVVDKYSRKEFVFNNNDLLIISTYKDAQSENKDTTIVKYNGKYPESSTTEWSFMKDMEFTSNGMFSKYSEGFHGIDYRTTRTYSFVTDEEYQMIKSVVETDINNTITSTRNFTYNDKKDIVKEVDGEYETAYIDYVYDNKNNWTSRTRQYRENAQATWQNPTTETRTISYWD